MSMPSQFGANPTPPAKSGTNWVVIILVILAVIVLVCGGLCAGGMYVARSAGGAITQSIVLMSIQTQAVPPLHASQEVTDKLGTIISQDMPTIVGEFSPDAPQLTCKFKVTGEKGEATATVVATRDGASYTPSNIQVQFADGSTVSVPTNNGPTELNFPTEEGDMPSDEPTPSTDAMDDSTTTVEEPAAP